MSEFIHKLRGFTLVEILVVLFLVGLVALPFTNMFLFGVQGSHDNAEHVLAYNLAREKLEEIKGLPFEVI
ncbi:MAG TPA: prepilin-type N-terminal cleavage/methylation domain-containing protein, partial [Candidatus Rifleibacterium sp.]|nr:prepilin-type N-terminal cleavage/methylation domain-containing protein [Candidatus Rifleibacterium sp.]